MKQHKYLALLLSPLLVTSTVRLDARARRRDAALKATEQQLVEHQHCKYQRNRKRTRRERNAGSRHRATRWRQSRSISRRSFRKARPETTRREKLVSSADQIQKTQFLPQTTFTAGTENLKLGSDFFNVAAVQWRREHQRQMVFVAYGVDVSFLKRNDLAGVDLRGKIVVFTNGPPPRSPRPVG